MPHGSYLGKIELQHYGVMKTKWIEIQYYMILLLLPIACFSQQDFEWAIKPQFDEAHGFKENHAIVSTIKKKIDEWNVEYQYFIIDKGGIVPTQKLIMICPYWIFLWKEIFRRIN
jgi:hypothetical protein